MKTLTTFLSILSLLAQGTSCAQRSGGSETRFNFSSPQVQAHGTVNVGLALSDGLVLAADSRLTLVNKQAFPGYMVLSDNNNKIFAVGKFGISTYGQAFLKNRTISSWVADYAAKQQQPNDDVFAFGTRFAAYIAALYDVDGAVTAAQPSDKPVLGFLIAGYDAHGDGRLLQLEYPDARSPSELLNTLNKQGAHWSGNTETITRLVKGADSRVLDMPFWATIPPKQKDDAQKQIDGLQYNIPFNSLMLQDGIDFATSLVTATVTFQRFSFGTVADHGAIPTVGGAVDVLVVRPTGVEWVKQKALTVNLDNH